MVTATLTADDGQARSSDSALVTVANVPPDLGALSARPTSYDPTNFFRLNQNVTP